jgi:capsular polysaccharide biosynthesis protein
MVFRNQDATRLPNDHVIGDVGDSKHFHLFDGNLSFSWALSNVQASSCTRTASNASASVR